MRRVMGRMWERLDSVGAARDKPQLEILATRQRDGCSYLAENVRTLDGAEKEDTYTGRVSNAP